MHTTQSQKLDCKIKGLLCGFWKIAFLILLCHSQLTCSQSDSAIELAFSVVEDVDIGSIVGRLPNNFSGTIINHDTNFRSFFDAAYLESDGALRTINTLDHETHPLFEASIFVNQGEGIIYKVTGICYLMLIK